MTVTTTTEPFDPGSRMYEAESLKLDQFEHNVPEVLRHFQGRQAFLKILRFDIPDLIKFVNEWKSGEGFQKLEYLKIEVLTDYIPPTQVLRGVMEKRIDRSKKRLAHTLPKVFIDDKEKPNTEPIISPTYVVRESDNRVASILIQNSTFSFGVWDVTEEETFLKF
ncbi:Protein CBG22216 [Caenorhabditis briggsae]|uniref:Protein CBG22216 n=2 Tax=Caenorhabditis briggsae TaxID=6238 RepID=A8Y1T4_CAEBR|nr:Protein CBG22216 [Caenorhabditis briggsae]ULU09786.1 hypothetical protein L3Y34_014277 [Caenorhabditis briggsae]CAP38854.1 Protein CBG22216 [Caenorhabditis briggsae]